MTTTEPRYSLTELAGLAGVTPRTVRFYLSQGLLPSPGAVGPGAKYDDSDLDRLRLIRRLQREHLPLAEIRQRLAGLDDTAITALAEAEPPAAAPPDSALEYIRRVLEPDWRAAPAAQLAPSAPEPVPRRQFDRSQWERISIGPDIELHVRRPLPRHLAKQVDRFVSIARDLLEEDPS